MSQAKAEVQSSAAGAHHPRTLGDLFCPRPSLLEIDVCVAPSAHSFPSYVWFVLPFSHLLRPILVVRSRKHLYRLSSGQRTEQDLSSLSHDSLYRVRCMSLRRSLRRFGPLEVCRNFKHLTKRWSERPPGMCSHFS